MNGAPMLLPGSYKPLAKKLPSAAKVYATIFTTKMGVSKNGISIYDRASPNVTS